MLNSISDEERKQRQDALNYAIASSALEGVEMSNDDMQRALSFVNGEMDLDEFINGDK